MSTPNAGMTAARQNLIDDLLDMNTRILADLDARDLGFTIEQAAGVARVVQESTIGTLQAIDGRAQIFPCGHGLGPTPFFMEAELVEAYCDAINS